MDEIEIINKGGVNAISDIAKEDLDLRVDDPNRSLDLYGLSGSNLLEVNKEGVYKLTFYIGEPGQLANLKVYKNNELITLKKETDFTNLYSALVDLKK